MTGDGERGSGWRQGPSVAVVAAASVSALVVVGLAVAILLLMRDPVGGGIADGGAGNAGDVSGVNADGTGGGASSSSDSPSDSPSDLPSDAPPAVLEQCSDSGEAVLPRSGRGSEATSCEFAVAVHQAYFRTARPGDPAMVEAFSPATGQRYEMGCVENHNDGGIICRGGENAVVILY